MKLTEVIALIGAGYTKEEIAALEAAEAGKPAQPEQPKPKTDPKPALDNPDPKPTEAKKDPAPVPPTSEAAAQITQAVNDFTKALQSFNITAARQPATPTPQDSVNEILTKFCNM